MNSLHTNVLYHGKEDPLLEKTALRAGPLSLVYDGGDLRYIRLGDQEILRRVYVALRDRDWGTVLPALSNLQIDSTADSFRITYDAEFKQGDTDFLSQATITGSADGTITFDMDGVARCAFWRSRIGFCILHPIRECAGQPCSFEKVDGTVEQGVFPLHISPHQPSKELRAISHQVVPGVWATVRFEGDIFEMEDQRNWTDASFKTYSTPLRLPYPVEVKPETRISQSVALTLKGTISQIRVQPRDDRLTISVGKSPVGRLPNIGLGIASDGKPLSQKEAFRLKTLNISHLRVDVLLASSDYEKALFQAAAQAARISVPLEVALFVSDDAEKEFASLNAVIAKHAHDTRLNVLRWLVFDVTGGCARSEWMDLARTRLAHNAPEASFGSGTDVYFAQLNRNRPPVDSLDFVSYSINPQVHAFDNSSLIENLEAQAQTVENARLFINGLPLVITPITLKPRFKPGTRWSASKSKPGKLPLPVDPRQMSLFGAVWFVGSLKYIAESGVSSVTYFETTGWRGVMETDEGSPLPKLFPSIPGSVFPLYHAMADVGEFAGGDVIPSLSSDALRVDGLAVRKGDHTRVLLGNMSPEALRLSLRNLGHRGRVRHLDETNVEVAMRSPEQHRVSDVGITKLAGGTFQLDLEPYAVATIDTWA